MDEAVASGFTEAFRQNMQHQQVKKVFSCHSSCPILVGFSMKIPEGDIAVLAGQMMVTGKLSIPLNADISGKTNSYWGLESNGRTGYMAGKDQEDSNNGEGHHGRQPRHPLRG